MADDKRYNAEGKEVKYDEALDRYVPVDEESTKGVDSPENPAQPVRVEDETVGTEAPEAPNKKDK